MLGDKLFLRVIAASQGNSSSFRTHVLSTHTKTQIEVLQMFLDIKVDVTDEKGSITIEVEP